MRTEELLKLADLLDTVPAKEFHLKNWDCGTTACACGWAARHGIGGLCFDGFDACDRVKILMIAHPKMFGWNAVQVAFDIDEESALYLFDIESYARRKVKPSQVAARIRRFCKKNG